MHQTWERKNSFLTQKLNDRDQIRQNLATFKILPNLVAPEFIDFCQNQSLWAIFLGGGLFSIWQNLDPTLAILHSCERPKIEKIIWSHLNVGNQMQNLAKLSTGLITAPASQQQQQLRSTGPNIRALTLFLFWNFWFKSRKREKLHNWAHHFTPNRDGPRKEEILLREARIQNKAGPKKKFKRAHLLFRRSEFESCWFLQFFL